MAKRKIKKATLKKGSISDRVTKWMVEGSDFCDDIHKRVEENNSYIAGEQWKKGDLERQKQRERPAMPLNKVMPVLNAIANREVMNRYIPKAYARSEEDGPWAEVANDFIKWQRDMAEAEHEETMAFRSAVASGYGVMHFWWDQMANEGDGLICEEDVPIWKMLWDSSARKQNMVDRRWHMCGEWIPIKEAEQRWGVSKESRAFFEETKNQEDYAFGGSSMSVMKNSMGRWSWQGVTNGRWVNKAEKEIFVIETEYRDVKTFYRVAIPRLMGDLANLYGDPAAIMDLGVDETTQQPMQLTGEQFAQMEPEAQAQFVNEIKMDTEMSIFEEKDELIQYIEYYNGIFGEDPVWAAQDKWAVKYAIMTSGGGKGQEIVLEEGARPMGFTYEFLTGFPWETREAMKFIGFVDLAKGLQDWRNSFMSLALTRLATSPKSQMLIEEGVIDDQDEFLNGIANPRGVQFVPDGFVQSGRWIKLDPPSFAPVDREFIALADQGIPELAGLSGVELGQQGDLRRVSGTVVQSVKEASNTVLALLFDSLRRFRKRTGKLLLAFMREFYTAEEIARIAGDADAQFIIPEEQWPEASRFDIKFDEGRASVEEKMEQFDLLTRTGTWQDMLNRDMMPSEIAVEMIPTLTESEKAKMKQHIEQKKLEQNQLQQLLQMMQQDPNAKAIADQFQAQMQQQGR